MSVILKSLVDNCPDTKQGWARVGTGVIVAGLTMYLGQKWLFSKTEMIVSPTAVKVTLMAHEQSTMAMVPAVTTITRFSCNGVSPESLLWSKVADLLKKNPWLAGRLKTDEDGLHLSYEPIAPNCTVGQIAAIATKHLSVIDDMDLPEGASYDELEAKLKPLQVKSGNACANKDEVLFKVSLINVKNSTDVVLVFSMSHVLADGFTFYQLQNMLDKNTPVTSMEVVRSTRYEREVQKLKQQPEIMGPAAVLGMISCSLFRSAMRMYIVQVEPTWIEAQKKAFLTRSAQRADNSKEKATFVSTNDILTAWHNEICHTDLALMSINCRNRVPSFTNKLAGNYENGIMYNTPSDGHSPEAIRESLKTFRNASNTVPSTWKLLQWNTSITTNWCSFYQQIDISDAATGSVCKYKTHLPVINSKDLSFFREGMVVFKMDAEHVGLFVFTRRLTPEILEGSGVGRVLNSL